MPKQYDSVVLMLAAILEISPDDIEAYEISPKKVVGFSFYSTDESNLVIQTMDKIVKKFGGEYNHRVQSVFPLLFDDSNQLETAVIYWNNDMDYASITQALRESGMKSVYDLRTEVADAKIGYRTKGGTVLDFIG